MIRLPDVTIDRGVADVATTHRDRITEGEE